MRLRIDVSGASPAVLIEEPDDCTSLSITAPEDRRTAAAWALRRAALGVLTEDGTGLLDASRLRTLAALARITTGGAQLNEWNTRFDGMLDYARSRGWLAPDGRIWVHAEWQPAQLVPVNVTGEEFRQALGHFASGITIISAISEERPVGMTCQSFMSLSLDPPMVAVAPSRTSTSWPLMEPAGTVGISILTDEQAEVCRRFAIPGGDKFGGLEWTAGAATGVPLIAGALARLECGVETIHEAGDHLLVMARVFAVDVTPGRPLLYYRSDFEALAAR